jgi:hypothetical protein
LGEKELHFIQNYGHNEDCSLNAWKKMEKSANSVKKKREEETKKQLNRWRECKRRVDAANA